MNWRRLWVPVLAVVVGWFSHHFYRLISLQQVDGLVAACLISLLILMFIGLGLLSYLYLIREPRDDSGQPEQMGPYRLEILIGQGGMGRVYRARHALLRRPTAVKVLAANPENLQAVERFEREVRLTSRLTHPNTIAIYDYGRTADNRFYYAMEYIQGITLGQCVAEAGAQSEARTVFVMSQVCSALAEAHTAGLIHRDIKPGNIMLCERGGKSDFVKVLDFGLVWRFGLEKDNPAGSMHGTPRYMTPEAIRDPASQDARSDVYQLGALMYFFLTGSNLFPGDSVEGLCEAHLHSVPELPSVRLGHALNPEFEALLMSCLEKDAAKRPADACELLAHLEAFNVHGQWGQEQARHWWRQWMAQHEEMLLQRYSHCSETEELLA